MSSTVTASATATAPFLGANTTLVLCAGALFGAIAGFVGTFVLARRRSLLGMLSSSNPMSSLRSPCSCGWRLLITYLLGLCKWLLEAQRLARG